MPPALALAVLMGRHLALLALLGLAHGRGGRE